MPPRIECNVSGSVARALEARAAMTGASIDTLVDSLLSEALELERHSLFQVSTSNALVKGVFGGSTTVAHLLEHGDFGLGTFEGLDGKLIMIEGECFRATADGEVSAASDDREVPFALVTRFATDDTLSGESVESLQDLMVRLDTMRPSENLFAAFKIHGLFDGISMRSACKARPGEGLLEATLHQSEFEARGVPGSLVGFWAPEYTTAVSVPGYHLHFISDDRNLGGHVLDLIGTELSVDVQHETTLHLSLPETEEFLRADLSGQHARDLEAAETAPSGNR